MKTILNIIAVAILLAIAAFVVMGIYYGFSALWGMYSQLELVVRVVLLTGVITALVSAVIIAAGLRAAARLKAKSQLSDARHELYAHVIDLYRRYVEDAGAVNMNTRDEVLGELNRIGSDMMLLAGGAAQKAHHELKQAIENGESDYDRLTNLLAQLVKGFRRDLGHAYNYEELKFSDLLASKDTEQAGHKVSDPASLVTNNG